MKNQDLKRRIIEISYPRKLSHLGSNLTAVDIIDGIYQTKDRDEKFILSCGHAHLAHLVVMEKHGLCNAEEALDKYGIHCDIRAGCDLSTGSLGQGLPVALGMALADRQKRVFCLISDGESAEGSIWESLNIWCDDRIDNLKVYMNNNGYAAYRETSNMNRLKNYGVRVVNTFPEFSFLEGQQAHYRVLNDDDYSQAIGILK